MSNRELASLIEEAQRWEEASKTGGPATRAAFAAWIKRSPQHLQAYLQHWTLETELQRLDDGRELDIGSLLAQCSSNVVQLETGMPVAPDNPRVRKRWLLYVAAAASVLLCAGVWLLRGLRPSAWTDYSTATGEQRRIALIDGSIIELNTQSHIRVSLRGELREVVLVAGEALFDVRHDSHRPFRVHAGRSVIEDLGTEFSIYLRPDASTRVSVLDGQVRISPDVSRADSTLRNPSAAVVTEAPAVPDLDPLAAPTRVSAGEEVQIVAGGKAIKRATVNLAEAASWRRHRLWFEGASLEEVAAEFNRYNRRKIQVGDDPLLRKKRYTAAFDAYDPESFVQYLAGDPSLAVHSSPEGMVIQAH